MARRQHAPPRPTERQGTTHHRSSQKLPFVASAWRPLLDAYAQLWAAGSPAPRALMVVDVDHFHRINDRWGLDVGDKLLSRIAHHLQSVIDRVGVIVRIEGDAFCILLASPASEMMVTLLSNQLVTATEAHVWPVESESVRMTISVGTAYASAGDSPTVATLLTAAERALRQAKGQGKNQAVSARLNPRDREADTLSDQAVLEALARHELEPSYQPIVRTHDRKLIGAEALVRWHTLTGPQLPGSFIPAIEALGLMDRTDMALLTQALEQFAAWIQTYRHRFLIGINITPALLYHPTFPRRLDALLVRTGVPANRLVLEIPERITDSQSPRIIRALHDLKSIGVFLALDDFGAGTTSVGLLKTLPLDAVKIDMQFIHGIGVHTVDELIISQIVALAEHVGLVAVAEGVETPIQQQFLTSIGCPQMQGFAVAPALEADAFAKWAFDPVQPATKVSP